MDKLFPKYVMMENHEGKRSCFYGGLDDFDEEETEGFDIEVDEKDWTCEELVEIFGEELENWNHHRETDLGNLLLNSLNASNIPEDEKKTVLYNFIKEFMHSRNMIRK